MDGPQPEKHFDGWPVTASRHITLQKAMRLRATLRQDVAIKGEILDFGES